MYVMIMTMVITTFVLIFVFNASQIYGVYFLLADILGIHFLSYNELVEIIRTVVFVEPAIIDDVVQFGNTGFPIL